MIIAEGPGRVKARRPGYAHFLPTATTAGLPGAVAVRRPSTQRISKATPGDASSVVVQSVNQLETRSAFAKEQGYTHANSNTTRHHTSNRAES